MTLLLPATTTGPKAALASAPPIALRGDPETDIEERILRRREMSHLFQWYYPEGGWGWIVLVCAALSGAIANGFQLGFGHPLAGLVKRRFRNADGGEISDTQIGRNNNVTHSSACYTHISY